ncbi:MAG: 5-dehydro-4-deoxy-D-glucuronate isomerase [Candidatus Latescibacteria bacterium]|jgi:4-deoxy-L-threo-5-hexosulose-uronate ketol-isomerase|nr:5-dehydro-4-deoxy-D-glucuronate isomerase [Candidatus Latescibacterota bacterium]
MEVRYVPDPIRFERMNTSELRKEMLVDNLFKPGEITLLYSDVDRAIIGSATPTGGGLKLVAGEELKAEYFAQRREIGVINIGGDGSITVDSETYSLVKFEALYIGRGSKDIEFKSAKADNPAKFYILSYPAHMSYPTTHITIQAAEPVKLGSSKECNERTIYKYVHPGGVKSCQLVMGCTLMEEGSVWNTMPAHTHERRSEIYMYFDLDDDASMFKFIGKPDETRHIVVKNGQAVISPSWSIHSGAGTTNYSFIWAMGGENQDFGDMDHIAVKDLR